MRNFFQTKISKTTVLLALVVAAFLLLSGSIATAAINNASVKASLDQKCSNVSGLVGPTAKHAKLDRVLTSAQKETADRRIAAMNSLCKRDRSKPKEAAAALIGLCTHDKTPIKKQTINGRAADIRILTYENANNYYTGTVGIHKGSCPKIVVDKQLKALAKTTSLTPVGIDGQPVAAPSGGGGNSPSAESPTNRAPDSQQREQNAAPEPTKTKCEAKDTEGNCIDPSLAQCWPGDGEKTISRACDLYVKYVNPIIKFLSALVGIAVVIGIISGGIRYAASADDPQKAAAGKTQIKGAIIALFVYIFLMAGLQWLIPGGVW